MSDSGFAAWSRKVTRMTDPEAHLTDEEITRSAYGTLNDDERRAHIKGCQQCQERRREKVLADQRADSTPPKRGPDR